MKMKVLVIVVNKVNNKHKKKKINKKNNFL